MILVDTREISNSQVRFCSNTDELFVVVVVVVVVSGVGC